MRGSLFPSSPIFETHDLMFASFLVAQEYEVKSTWNEGRRVIFVFDVDEDFALLRREWLAGKAQVNAQAFANAIKNLKIMVHETGR